MNLGRLGSKPTKARQIFCTRPQGRRNWQGWLCSLLALSAISAGSPKLTTCFRSRMWRVCWLDCLAGQWLPRCVLRLHAGAPSSCRGKPANQRTRSTRRAAASRSVSMSSVSRRMPRGARRHAPPGAQRHGVVLHTNLGRAPLAAAALARDRRDRGGYLNLEYRSRRGAPRQSPRSPASPANPAHRRRGPSGRQQQRRRRPADAGRPVRSGRGGRFAR